MLNQRRRIASTLCPLVSAVGRLFRPNWLDLEVEVRHSLISSERRQFFITLIKYEYVLVRPFNLGAARLVRCAQVLQPDISH